MRLRRSVVAVSMVVPAVLVLSSCNGSSGGSGGQAAPMSSDVLTIGAAIAPNSLNPALGGSGQPQAYYYELAYDTLIHRAPSGELEPGLATSWSWEGTDNTVLDLQLRDDITFSDGSARTADVVKQSLLYYKGAGGPLAGNLQTIDTIDVVSDDEIRINLSQANPDLPDTLSLSTTGNVISGEALADPDSLGTSTAGSGQYMLDPDQTVSGQTYTYVPNPNYVDQDAIHWSKVVVKVISDPNATLAALKSGEIDYTVGDATTAQAAQDAGFQVSTTPGAIMQLIVLDRAGQISQPLGDLRVRQAMMYAMDRSAMAQALLGQYASAYDAPVLEGADGYSPDLVGQYSYDVDKAKELLAEAGYADGFTLPIITNITGIAESRAAQAFAADMANIGIDVQITVPANTNQLFSTYATFPAMMFSYGSPQQSSYSRGNDLLYSWGNPSQQDDPQLDSLWNQATTAPVDQQEQGWQAFTAGMADDLVTLPMFSLDVIYYARPGIADIGLSATNPFPPLVSLTTD